MPAVSRSIAATLVLLSFTLTPAFGQEFYLGAMHETSEGYFPNPDSSSDIAGFIGLAGVRVPVSDRFFVAGEAEVMFGSDFSDSASEFSGLDGLHRYRAVIGAQIDNFSVFIGTGSGDMGLSSRDATSLGPTVNFGIDYAVNDSLTIRLEAIQDNFGADGSEPFDSDAVRVGTLFNF